MATRSVLGMMRAETGTMHFKPQRLRDRPTRRTSSTGFRLFGPNGADDGLAGFTIAQAQTQHCYALVDTTNVGDSWRVLLTPGTAVEPGFYLGRSSSNRQPLVYINGNQAIWGVEVARKAIIRWKIGPSDAFGVRVDDGVEVTGSASMALADWTRIFSYASGSEQSAVDAADIVLAGAVTAAEDTNLMNYLNNRGAVY